MQEKTVSIPNIMCGHCVMTIKRELGEIEGVREVEADAATRKARIRWDNPADWEQIHDTLVDIGYPPEEIDR
jgi:copper chaperone